MNVKTLEAQLGRQRAGWRLFPLLRCLTVALVICAAGVTQLTASSTGTADPKITTTTSMFTDLAGGSQFGHTLLSVILISNLVAILLQSLCAKLGIVTGRDLAQACRSTR